MAAPLFGPSRRPQHTKAFHMMKKASYILALILAVTQSAAAQTIPVPANYSIVDTVSGDLDKDLVSELVVAYNTGPENGIEGEGVPRALIIYKRNGKAWKEWKSSAQALYGSQDGGMMGDPYGDMEITNGVLHVIQNGGSSWKWGFTDKYRFQDGEFYLIGYTSVYGKPCEYWIDVDFNLSTGKMIVKKEFEDCESGGDPVIYKNENETMVQKGLKITLQNRHEREVKITTPQYQHEIYIAMGAE
jgi:hypothetical protein